MKIFYSFLLIPFVLTCTGERPQSDKSAISPSFTSDIESFRGYKYPDWFRDAKFGIWSHWGPQSVPKQGDWYARRMYESDIYDLKTNKPTGQQSREYMYHNEHYGHPSKFGYKDIIALWKAEKWDPVQLMTLYKRAGAKYFVSMATHYDNFFLWDSKIHRWNSVRMGPKKDIVGLWKDAALKEGLKFGVSEHLGASFTWFQPSHRADPSGPRKGIPYDGANPAYQDLYHKPASSDDIAWFTRDTANHRIWLNSITELIDLYKPDLLYSDGELPFGETGRKLLAHFYNHDIIKNAGKLEAVFTCKYLPSEGRWVKDVDLSAIDSISSDPWQTEASIGDWYYKAGQQYQGANDIIRMLVDIVSKNGNLLLNVVQTPEGDLDTDVVNILEEISRWTPVNGEGIFGTRPWKVFGEGHSLKNKWKEVTGGVLKSQGFEEQDIRFTSKDNNLFAFCMARPENDIKIISLGRNSKLLNSRIKSVTLLGSEEKLKWDQAADYLLIKKPDKLPAWNVTGFRITFRKKLITDS
ncbi:MAG TPA: alpha-L-fucosidase [Bacteroidales bacterium]|nr:alpha-L-fucosidase [Bacteroidales bacterium]